MSGQPISFEPWCQALLGRVVGAYRVHRVIGRGGMGVVFEAVASAGGAGRVAVKVLRPEHSRDPQMLQRFFNEARAAHLTLSPNLVQIFECGFFEDLQLGYLTMEFLEGEALGERVRRRGGRLLESEVVRLCVPVAATLAATHARGIIHRDLKPDNVFLAKSEAGERVKLLDFGLAKFLVRPGQAGPLGEPLHNGPGTQTGMLLGTPQFMAPELCRGSRDADDRADVYSLGVMLYQMLAGRPPFLGPGPGDFIVQHVTMEPPPLASLAAGLSQSMRTLVHEMLRKHPAERPTMRQVASALEALDAERDLTPRRSAERATVMVQIPREATLVGGAAALQGPAPDVRGRPRAFHAGLLPWVSVAGIVCGLTLGLGVGIQRSRLGKHGTPSAFPPNLSLRLDEAPAPRRAPAPPPAAPRPVPAPVPAPVPVPTAPRRPLRPPAKEAPREAAAKAPGPDQDDKGLRDPFGGR